MLQLLNDDVVSKIDLATLDIIADSCTLKMGEFQSYVDGKCAYCASPLYIELKDATVEYTVDANFTDLVLFKTSGMSDDMKNFVNDNFEISLNSGDTISFMGDITIGVPMVSNNSYTQITDGFAVTNQLSTSMSSNDAVLYDRDIDVEVEINANTPFAEIQYKADVTRYYDLNTDFKGTTPSSATSSTVVGYGINDLAKKLEGSVTFSGDVGSKSEKLYIDDINVEKQRIGKLDSSLTTLGLYIVDFQTIQNDVENVSVANVIETSDRTNVDQEAMAKEKIENLGGTCTYVPSEAKKLCEDLNTKLIGANPGVATSSFPVMLVIIVAVVAIAICGCGLVIFNRRN